MSAQEIIDRIYHPVYERAWADHAAGKITEDEAIERCLRADAKAWSEITRKTGMTPFHGKP